MRYGTLSDVSSDSCYSVEFDINKACEFMSMIRNIVDFSL